MRSHVLVVDDEPAVRFTLRSVLEDAGFAVTESPDGADALARLDGGLRPAVILSDLRMPKLDGLGLLRALAARPDAPRLVLITAHGDERTAVEAMKAGAWDYVRKPFDIDEIVEIVRRADEIGRLAADNERLSSALALSRTLVFRSPGMERLATLVHRVAGREVTVLIQGESGTGKERVAEAIVAGSPRADRPFVRFNCASLSPELAEAELFGHTRGAFTGATKDRPGLFREADGGTLFLDEVGELGATVQARLLRALQSGEVRPVGEDRARKVDVRVIAATHRDLAGMATHGTFREDLLYRLKVVSLRVPALRERPEDIPLLARVFAERAARRFGLPTPRIDDALLAALAARPWPGNVRELENAIEMMVALSDSGRLDPALMDDGPPESHEPLGVGLKERVDAYERSLIVAAMAECDGNKSEAARRLGVGRVTLYEKLRKHGLDGEDASDGRPSFPR
jgi:two-component system response regulator HydG